MPPLDFTSLANALDQLAQGLEEVRTSPHSELLRDGIIQRFEYSHELCIKFLCRVLENVFEDRVDSMPYNEVLRKGAERGLIADPRSWFRYRLARNKTSHTYDEVIAREVFTVAEPFLQDAAALLQSLHEAANRTDA
jgi:nucleotidyltransferase substrate binding protein (TIGR01987 family)